MHTISDIQQLQPNPLVKVVTTNVVKLTIWLTRALQGLCPKTFPFTIMDTGTDISIFGQGWSGAKYYNQLLTADGEYLRMLTRFNVCRALHKPNAQESLIPPAHFS
jgi:hypothetical protein